MVNFLLSPIFLLGFVIMVMGQLVQLDYEGVDTEGLSGLSEDAPELHHHHHHQQQYSFAAAPSLGLGLVSGLHGIGDGGNLEIPSSESITPLGIQEGGVPSGPNGEIATPTEQPPPEGQERRVGIASRLFGAGFLGKR